MTVYIFDVISDRQVSEKICLFTYLNVWLLYKAGYWKYTYNEKYTSRGIGHILILTEEYLLYK